MPLRRGEPLWFDLPGIVASFQAVVAPNAEMARYNQAPGWANLYRAADGVVPTWSAQLGWTFDGATQYLNTGITPPRDQTWTLLVRYSQPAWKFAGDWETLCGCFSTAGGNSGFLIQGRDHTEDRGFWTGSTSSNTAGVLPLNGVYGFAGKTSYSDGVADQTVAAGAPGGNHLALWLGGLNFDGSLLQPTSGSILAVAIYARTLSAGEMYAAYRQMQYCDVNPDWSAWSRRRDWWLVKGAAGTAYTQAVAGAQTNAGAMIRKTATAKAGAQTNTGAMIRKTATAKAGAWAGVGTLARKAGKVVAGAWSGGGALAKKTGKAGAGVWSSIGVLTRKASKPLAGAWSGAGALTRGIATGLSGAWSGAGGIAREVGKLVAGAWAGTGTLTRKIGKVVAGAWSGAGGIPTAIAQLVAGAWAGLGALVALLRKKTPSWRIYTPPAETRTYTPPAETRTYTVEDDD